MFSLRIVNVDSYQSAPTKGYDICYSEFRGCEIFKVPIIRIFGITPAGQKGCLHVHGVFPYFSIRCKDIFPNIEAKSLRKYMQELALDIDKALNVASRNSNSHRHHVYKVVVTEHVPFYGYHEKAEEFLKIYFYNPFDVSRAAELMTNGVILNKFIQPYEAHIPYILQFFIDYNLFGMNLIHVSKFKFRPSEDDLVSAGSPLKNLTLFHVLDENNSTSNKIWRMADLNSFQFSSLPRQTVCELEADCCSSEIRNRLNESSTAGKNPGLLAIWEDERQRRKVENNSSHITSIQSQERIDFIETESENFYKKKLRKILESFDVYTLCQKSKTHHMSKGSEESSPSISDLSSTQDEEMLNLMLSLVNSHSIQLDDDSILGFNHENDIQFENIEDETLEMSQLFSGELEEMWSSQVLNSDCDQYRSVSNIDCTPIEQSGASVEDLTIPQLDGAFDEDIKIGVKHTKKNKENSAAAISEESLIKSCTLFQPVVRLSPTIFLKTEIYRAVESRPERDFSSEFIEDSSSISSPRSPSIPICVPVSKSAQCSLIMNIYENSNNVSIEHTCSSRNIVQTDSLAEAEDPSNIVFEIITNLIYKVECLTEGKASCYEHVTREFCGKSCSDVLFQTLSPYIKEINKPIKSTPSDFKEKIHVNKRGCHTEPHLSLPIKKRIFSNNWNRDELNQCDSCSHSLSLDLSKIGKEIVLVKKLSESDFLRHFKFNTLKVVIPPLSLDLQVLNKVTSNCKNDDNSIKSVSPIHKKDFLSKRNFDYKNKICNNKEKINVSKIKFGQDNFNPNNACTAEQSFCKLSPNRICSVNDCEMLTNVALPDQFTNNKFSQLSDSEIIKDIVSEISVNIASNDLNLKINQNNSNSNLKTPTNCSISENALDEENCRQSKIPIIPDSFEPEIIPDNLDFLLSPENMESATNEIEDKVNSEIITSNSNSEFSSSLENLKIASNATSSESAGHETIHGNSTVDKKKNSLENANALNDINHESMPTSDNDKTDNATNVISNNISAEAGKTTIILSELRLYRRKKAYITSQHHSPVTNCDLVNDSDDHHLNSVEENTISIGSRVREKNSCDLEIEYIGTSTKSETQNFAYGIPVVQLEPCKNLIKKYCKNETDADCLILKEVTHEQKMPSSVKEKRFFRSRVRQSKDVNLTSNIITNHKLGINSPKYTKNKFLPLNRGRRNSLSNFSVRKTTKPVLRRRSMNFDIPDKKNPQSSIYFNTSSFSCEKNSIEQVYDFESPLNSAENDLGDNYFSRYSLKSKYNNNNLRKSFSNKLSLRFNKRRNKEAQDDYVPKHVNIKTISQKNIRPKRTLSVVSYNEEEDQPPEENRTVLKQCRKNYPKNIPNLPEIENSAPDDVYSVEDSGNEISDWSIDDDPVLQFRSREALKCIISKKKLNFYASHKNKKLPIPKFKVRKKKKSNPLNVNIKLVKSSLNYLDKDSSDLKNEESYYCISPKKKKHSKKSKKKSRTFTSALDVKQKYKKHKESKNEGLKNAILQYCNSVAKNKSSKLPMHIIKNEQESFQNKKMCTYSSPSLLTNCNLSTPKTDDLTMLNSSLTEDFSNENRRSKNSLKMKLKLRRITTRSKEERIVVVEKELEGIESESSDESKSSEPSERILVTNPINENEVNEKQNSYDKILDTKVIKSDINDLKLKAKFKCPLLIENKMIKKSLSYVEENLNKKHYKNKIPKFKYKPLLANISKNLMSENENNTMTNSVMTDASSHKVLIISPKKKSPLKDARSIKTELAQLNEIAFETKVHSNIYSVVSKISPEIPLDNQSQKKLHKELNPHIIEDDLLFSPQCNVQGRRLSSNSKISSHRNSLICSNFKKYLNTNNEGVAEEVSHSENQENCSNISSDLSANCKPCIIDLKKMSSLEIEKHIHKSLVNICKSETVCEPIVASFPSPIVDSKSADSYIDPKKIFENLFTFSSPFYSHSPVHSNTFETSSLIIENDMSCGAFSNDSSEHSRKEISDLNAQNPLKPNDVFKSIERDDMGVLWNLAYFSPPQIKVQEKMAFTTPFDKRTKSNYDQKDNSDNLSFGDVQKLIKKANETYSLSNNLIESESENSVIALSAKNIKANCKNDVSSKGSKISFKNILDKNINKVLNDVENIPSFSQTPTEFEAERVMYKNSESCEANFKISTIIKEEPKSDPVFKPEDSMPNTDQSLPNVRIFDFQECLVESDSEINPLLNDSEIDSVISSVDILSNGMDSQSYEQCAQTDIATESQNSSVENKLKLISKEPKNLGVDDEFIQTNSESHLQKLTCNNAIITAADTSSVLIPSYKNNTIPVLAINNSCQEATVNVSTFDEQNLNANGQFLPIMLASVSVAENASYIDDSAALIKENEPDPQESVNFLEDTELLQSCSVSSTSDIENKNIQTSNTLNIPFNGEEDILSMIVKSCDIGEEFDENMNSVEETEGESISSATLCDNLIDSNYVMPGSNFIISSQPHQNSFQTNSENAVSSSSENNLIHKNPNIVVIKTEPMDIPEVEQVVYQLQDKHLNMNPPSKNIKASEEFRSDNVLLDSMIHSFYGDNSLYGTPSSGTNNNISLLYPNFQSNSCSQKTESVASECNSASLQSSVMKIADNAVDTYKSDNYFKNISISQNNAFELKSPVINNKVSLNSLKNSVFVTHSFPKVSSKRFHFIPNIKPPTREFIENSLIKKDNVKDVTVTTVIDDILSPDNSPSSQISVCDDALPNVFKKSILNDIEFSKSQNSRSSLNLQVITSSSSLHLDRSKPILPSNHYISSTPSTSHTKKEVALCDAIISPINKGSELIADTSKRKRKLIFEDNPNGPLKIFKSSRGKMCDLYSRNVSLNISTDSFENLSYSQIDGPTLENSRGFKVTSDNYGDAQVKHEVQHLTIMSLEMHANTRNDLRPNPKFDSVAAIFYCIYNDVGINSEEEVVGMIAVDPVLHDQTDEQNSSETLKNYLLLCPGVKNGYIYCVENEISLFKKLVEVISEWDPDILAGYEIQMSSWGYLIERAEVLNINLRLLLSRLIDKNEAKLFPVESDPTVIDQTADLSKLNIIGRIVLCVWRLMRKEVTLNVYSFENVYYHVLHKRTPLYAFQDLTNWFLGSQKEKVIRYYVIRVQGCVKFLEKLDIINRTSELARLFGIQFYEVLSRGSQFRVESMMLRTAAPLSYIPVTPSVRQRSNSRAPECVPLILEPESKFYIDPIVVLDFQSLYPSVIIAYNYCFSTCLGRVEHFGKNVPFEFGCTSLSVPIALLQKLHNDIHISPTGIAFVKSSVRRGILPLMLEEILNTRVMVKQSMKKIKENNSLKKLFDARQLGLKLIANVTYGYTGASFSGRMPCVEVADSIVGKARETLERAIHVIENTSKWRAKVVYGDTDSLFILLPGRTKKQAFEIGQEIADAVTADNPKPVKLKFEKVYLPCVLQTKKRYVGFMYETIDQDNPVFDAKGIETVRRDSCPATAKILEKSLKILFKSYDVSLVKNYVQKQFRKLLNGHANIIDCIFAKEYRGISGYRPGACVPALEIAKKRLFKDPRSEPRVGERVPYVVVYGFPGLPIIQLVREPFELLRDPNLRINATYYITRVIAPPLQRIFNLLGADVKSWYMNLAHTFKPNLPMIHAANQHKGTLSQYFVTLCCPSCEKPTFTAICDDCREDLQGSTIALNEKIRHWERTVDHLNQICGSCTKSASSIDSCISLDCPMLFRLSTAKKELSQAPYLKKVLANELF